VGGVRCKQEGYVCGQDLGLGWRGGVELWGVLQMRFVILFVGQVLLDKLTRGKGEERKRSGGAVWCCLGLREGN